MKKRPVRVEMTPDYQTVALVKRVCKSKVQRATIFLIFVSPKSSGFCVGYL